MRSVAFLTDSSSCLSNDLLGRYHVRVLPIVIHLPTRDIRDGMPGASKLVYQALARGEPVKSSAPSTLEYLSAIEEEAVGTVVVVTPAAEFTVMYRNASVAGEIARRPAVVVDSRTAAAAQGLVVLAACEAAEAGGSAQDVVETARYAAGRAELVAGLDSVEFIGKSGRVSPLALGLARHLGIHPVFRLKDGEVERLGVPRSSQAVLERIRREALSRGLKEASLSMVFHAGSKKRAGELRDLIGGSRPITEFSPSMGIHTGPGVIGVAWLRRPDGT
jgi:DegV family protein with EDD domain